MVHRKGVLGEASGGQPSYGREAQVSRRPREQMELTWATAQAGRTENPHSLCPQDSGKDPEATIKNEQGLHLCR